jgi:hypothetical protein
LLQNHDHKSKKLISLDFTVVDALKKYFENVRKEKIKDNPEYKDLFENLSDDMLQMSIGQIYFFNGHFTFR